MEKTVTVVHSIPGRIRLHIPLLVSIKEFDAIEELLSSITGIEKVSIEGITQSMVIHYDKTKLKVSDILHYVSLFFVFIQEDTKQQNTASPSEEKRAVVSILSAWYRLIVTVEKNVKAHEKILNCGKIVYKIATSPIRKKRE